MFNNWKWVWGMVALVVMGVVFGSYFANPAWAQKAANIKDVSNPDKQVIYSKVIPIFFNSGDTLQNTTASPVPAGKRLIVEHVSLIGSLPTGQIATAYIYEAGLNGVVYLIAVPQGTANGYDNFSVSQPARFRLEPGQILGFHVDRSGSSGSASFNFSVLGYLIDYP